MLVSRPCIKQNLSAYALTLAFIFFLTSCAYRPQPTVIINTSSHQLLLKKQKNWLIEGKLGFKSPEKKQSANFRWQQTPQQFQLNMTSIIGTSLLNMKGNEDGASLITDNETYQDPDASHLIWRVTGWQIPVEKLRFWIKGQYQQNDQVITSEQGWVSQLKPVCHNCKNWVINYDNYRLVNKIWLPHKVVLNNRLNNNQLLIRINKWNLHE